jgi:PAS domain S-box-containing protein
MTDTPLDKQSSTNNNENLSLSLLDRDIKEQLLIKDRAIASSIHGIGITDLEGNIIYINDAALRMWGADDPSEVIGQSALEFAQSQDEAVLIMLKVIETGSWEGEIAGHKKDGTPISVHLAANIIYNDKGEPICAMDSFIDISDLVAYRKKIEHVAQDLTQLIDTANAPIFGIDKAGKVNEWNQMAVKITGFRKEEVLGRDLVKNFITDDYKAAVKQVLDNALKGEQTTNYELPLYTKSDQRVLVLLNATTRRDADGNIIGVVGVGQDITKLDIYRKERERVAQDLTQLIDTANAPIFGIDKAGKVNEWNQMAIKITGFSKEEVLGRNLVEDFITDNYKAPVKQVLDNALKGEQTTNYELPLYTKSDQLLLVLLNATTRRDTDGSIIGVVGVGQDITDRKKVEEDLRIKDFAIASSIQGIGIGDLEGNITYVNNAALKIWGAEDPSEVIGRSSLELAESQEEAEKIMLAVLENGSWEGEVKGVRKDGTPAILQLAANIVYNDKGEPICTMDSFIDITERKKMEEELRIKDFAIASAIQGIGIGDLEGNITYVNNAALKIWGADDPSEVIGQSSLELAESQEEAEKIMLAVLENGSWEGEVKGVRKDGSPAILHLAANIVYNDKGEPICTMDSFIDITDRKKIEEDLRIKDFAVSSSIQGIVIGDLAGDITYVNRSFLNMWGDEDTSEIIGKSAISFAKDQSQAEKAFVNVLDAGSWNGEIEVIIKDDSIITVLVSANLVTDADNNPICMMASFVDITDRKRAEEKLEKLNTELEARVAERTQELSQQSLMLQETNTALKILLKQREQDKDDLEDKVLSNVKELILPYIEKLKNTRLDSKQKTYLEILDSNLNEIISPYLKKLSVQFLNFTPMQIQVADLVKAGKTTKEISDLLNLSDRAIEFHRNNIRNNLGLKNKKVNLRTYLLSLSA